MDYWFSELHTKDVKLSIRVDRQLYSGHSDFQRIDVFDSPEFGRFLVLDGYMMLTQKDEFIYHEMIVHPAMAVHPRVRRVLVIGGGDGGAVRELCRYDDVEHIDLVEIDKQVVDVSREFFPEVTCSLDDPRVTIHYRDSAASFSPKSHVRSTILAWRYTTATACALSEAARTNTTSSSSTAPTRSAREKGCSRVSFTAIAARLCTRTAS